MMYISAIIIGFLCIFVVQSLSILLNKRDKFLWFLPVIGFTALPYILAKYTAFSVLPDNEKTLVVLCICFLAGTADIIGWIAGLKFRKIIEAEIEEMDKLYSREDNNDDSNEKTE